MNPREIVPALLLGLLGIVAAGAIALAADSIAGEEIGLSANPVPVVSDQDRLVDPGERRDRDLRRGPDDDRASNETDDDASRPGPGSGEREEVESPDDEDVEDNSGSGSSNSGSGSSNSGSGSSNSGSGSSNSGSGSDDSGGSDD